MSLIAPRKIKIDKQHGLVIIQKILSRVAEGLAQRSHSNRFVSLRP